MKINKINISLIVIIVILLVIVCLSDVKQSEDEFQNTLFFKKSPREVDYNFYMRQDSDLLKPLSSNNIPDMGEAITEVSNTLEQTSSDMNNDCYDDNDAVFRESHGAYNDCVDLYNNIKLTQDCGNNLDESFDWEKCGNIDLGFGVVSDLCPITTGKIDQNNCIRNSYSKQKQTLTRSSNSIKIGTDTQNKVLRYQNARIIGLSKAITNDINKSYVQDFYKYQKSLAIPIGYEQGGSEKFQETQVSQDNSVNKVNQSNQSNQSNQTNQTNQTNPNNLNINDYYDDTRLYGLYRVRSGYHIDLDEVYLTINSKKVNFFTKEGLLIDSDVIEYKMIPDSKMGSLPLLRAYVKINKLVDTVRIENLPDIGLVRALDMETDKSRKQISKIEKEKKLLLKFKALQTLHILDSNLWFFFMDFKNNRLTMYDSNYYKLLSFDLLQSF